MKRYLMLLGITFSIPAFGLDMEYITYNGFDTLLPAFQRLALIFTDNNYLSIFISFIIMGILFGGMAFSYRMLTGQQASVHSWFWPILIGVILFQGLLLPRGNIILSDPVKNEFQVIGGVPDAIVAVAGIFNLIERSVVDVVDVGSAYPYAEDMSGISFSLIQNATSSALEIDDYFLSKTLVTYIEKCGSMALNSPASAVNDHRLKRDTFDLRAEMAAMALLNVDTIVYSNADKWGVVTRCEDAWNVNINPFLNDANFLSVEQAICAKVGFAANRPQQLDRCRARMLDAMEHFGIPAGTFNATHFIRNIFLAQATDKALQHSNPDLTVKSLANRDLMVQGVGLSVVANEWLPQIRAIMTSVALGIVPIMALFLVTPLVVKVLLFVTTLFAWLTVWGVTDAIMHEMAMDAAAQQFQQLSSFGLDAIYLAPEASARAMGLMGKNKTYSITIATVIAMALWRFGGYAFSQMTDNWANHVEGQATSAAMRTQTPEGYSKTLSEMTDSMSNLAMRQNHSASSVASSDFMQRSSGIASGKTQRNLGAEQGVSAAQVASQLGAVSGASAMGNVEALKSLMHAENGVDGSEINSDQLAQYQQQLSYIQSLSGSTQTQAMGQALKDFGGGNFVSGAIKASTVDAYSKVGNTQMVGQLADQIRNSSANRYGVDPSSFSNNDVFNEMAKYQFSDQYAKVLATEGNADSLVSVLANNQSMDLARMDSLVETGLSFGLSPQQMGIVSGSWDAAITSSKAGAFAELSPQEVAFGYYRNHLAHGMGAQALEQVAESENMSLPELIEKTSEIGASRDLANYLKVDYAATQFDVSHKEATLMQEGHSNQLTVPNESIPTMVNSSGFSDVLSSGQKQFMMDGYQQGESVALSYAFDPNKGNNATNISIRSGSNVFHDDRFSVDDSTQFQGGMALTANAIDHLVTNGNYQDPRWAAIETELSNDWNGQQGEPHQLDGQFSRSLVDSLNRVYGSIGSYNNTDSDTFSKQVSAGGRVGFDMANVPFVGPVINKVTGSSLSFHLESSGNQRWADTDSMSTALPTGMVFSGIEHIMQNMPDNLAKQGVTEKSPDYEMEMTRNKIFMDQFSNLHESYLSFLKGENREEFEKSEIYDEIFDKWKKSNGGIVTDY